MTALYLLDPPSGPHWFPFADCRPISELRAGAWLIRERWEGVADAETRAIFGPPHLEAFVEEGVPPVTSRCPVEGPAIVARADFAPSGVRPKLPANKAQLVHEGVTVGWWVPPGDRWQGEADEGEPCDIEGLLLYGVFDLLAALEHFLAADCADFLNERSDPIPDGSIVIGDPQDVVLLGAMVEPQVVFDTRQGAIVLEERVYVNAGTRLEGPLYVGAGTHLLGGPIGHCAIGPRCKIRGEMHSSVTLGYANKAHDGFVGHSVLGRWVNLGAGTVTSNLKNTYGPVRLTVAGTRLDTGRQFLGSLIGDHAKVAIGTFLDTGTVVGIGANVFGAARPPKYVPPFAWGLSGERVTLEGFLEIAERVLPRREVTLTDAMRESLTSIYRNAVNP